MFCNQIPARSGAGGHNQNTSRIQKKNKSTNPPCWFICSFSGTDSDGVALAQVAMYSIAKGSWATLSPATVAASERAAVSLAAVQFGENKNKSKAEWLSVVAGGQLGVYTTGALSALTCAGPTSAVEVFDATSNKWTHLANLTTARRGLGLATQLSLLYAIGGHNGTHYVGTAEVFDVAGAAGSAWRPLEPMQHPRAGAAVGVVGGHLVVAGGVGAAGSTDVVE